MLKKIYKSRKKMLTHINIELDINTRTSNKFTRYTAHLTSCIQLITSTSDIYLTDIKHTNLHTNEITNLQTHKHRNLHTHKHTNWHTHKLTHAKTHKLTHAQTDTRNTSKQGSVTKRTLPACLLLSLCLICTQWQRTHRCTSMIGPTLVDRDRCCSGTSAR